MEYMQLVWLYAGSVVLASFVGGFALKPGSQPGWGMFVVVLFWPIAVPIVISIIAGQTVRIWILMRSMRRRKH